MRKILVVAFLLFLQTAVSQKLQLGKVTVEELKEKSHGLDPSAGAAFVFKTGHTSFVYSKDKWLVTTTVKVKIKIYNKNGFEKANQGIAYYVGGGTVEKAFFSDAVTYNLVDGKIEKTKLKTEGEFIENVNDEWKIKKIVLPAVKEGSIIEFSYELISPHITRINDWYFQGDIPVNSAVYTALIPQYFQYRTIITGYEAIDKKTDIVNGAQYAELKTTYSGSNIGAIREESFVNNIKNYTSILKYELASVSKQNGLIENLSQDWSGVTKQIYDDDNFGKQMKLGSYFEEELKQALGNKNSPDERIKAILQFVKTKMTWDGKFGIFCDKGVKKAYTEKTGNVAEINLMLIAMLKYAGIKANPVLLSTKSNGIPSFPNRTVFNYVVAAVEDKQEFILLDATNHNSFFNILPTRTLNWAGRLIRDNGRSEDIDLMPTKVSIDKVSVLASIDESGGVSGKLREQYYDYAAFLFRENNDNLNNQACVVKLEKKFQGIEISNYSLENVKNLESPIIENYSFEHNDLVERIGGKMYLSAMLFFEKKENPFKQEERKFPVDITIPYSDSFSIVINIPKGYEVESLPENMNLIMDGNYGHYSFVISNSLNTIQISSTYTINASLIPSIQYKNLKQFYKMMIDKQNEKIVLNKIK
ncbi:DUF3857 domain-containing protein [Flavobacterium ardleyense]|uniref:DUF3857 domain-containing protein n=1 Tax=Flavobacterium ardleyense TaxID=2038737 RepID=A0ABW5Z5T5_9FLAO